MNFSKRKSQRFSIGLPYEPLAPREMLAGDVGIELQAGWSVLADTGPDVGFGPGIAEHAQTFSNLNELGDDAFRFSTYDVATGQTVVNQASPQDYNNFLSLTERFVSDSAGTGVDSPVFFSELAGDLAGEIQPFTVTPAQESRVGDFEFTNGDGNSSTCSGTLVSDFHVLTAAHCVVDNDGSYSDFKFYAGRDGSDRPYGVANALSWTWLSSYVDGPGTRWDGSSTEHGDLDYDLAIVELDRNLGDTLGNFGYGTRSDSWYQTATAQSLGYPADSPFSFSTNELQQSTGQPGNHRVLDRVVESSNMTSIGGMSGGPLHDNNIAVGVNSYGYTTGGTDIAGYKRITSGNFSFIQDTIAEDTVPTDRADLISRDVWYQTSEDSVDASFVEVGGSIQSTIRVQNIGTESSGAFTIRYRLSTDAFYDTSDIFLDDFELSGLSRFQSGTYTNNATIPSGVTLGQDYYVVYKIDAFNTVSEFVNSEGNDSNFNNEGYVSTPISIVAPDDHGNDATSATFFSVPGFQLGEIEFGNDADWFRFNVAAGNQYEFETFLNTLSDTTLSLYDTDGTTRLLFNDDGGSGLASAISWEASADGVYYLKVESFGSNTGSYVLAVDVIDDHGNDSSTATPLAIPFSAQGDIETADDADYFSFDAVAGDRYEFETTLDTLGDSTLTLTSAAGTMFPVFDDDGGTGLASLISWEAPASGVYYLAVRSFGTNTGTYQLTGNIGDNILLGDANFDGEVNFLDINPMIFLLGSGGFLEEADVNRDGDFNFLDLGPFISLLTSGGSAQSNLADSQQTDYGFESRNPISLANNSSEKAISTAAELFDEHPETLNEVFDFELAALV